MSYFTRLIQSENPLSQKAKGIEAINRGVFPHAEFSAPAAFVTARGWLGLSSDEKELAWTRAKSTCYGQGNDQVILRPCPTVPRHGFVDSRRVHTVEQITRVAEETLAADPNGELIFMQMIDASASMVVTPGSVVVGAGRDGATQGKQPLLNFSLYPDALPIDLPKESWPEHGIKAEEVPYLEYVGNLSGYKSRSQLYLVQVRAGPNAGGAAQVTTDYVPEETVVTSIFEPTEDALEFERMAERAAITPGMVCHHPGGCRITHFSAHCVSRGVPVVFGALPPKIGSTLAVSREAPTRYNKTMFYQGVKLAWGATPTGMIATSEHNGYNDGTMLRQISAALPACILLIHHSQSLATPFGSFAMGWAMGLFVRISAMLCIGEQRHSKRRKPLREKVYNAVLDKEFGGAVVTKSFKALRDFVELPWSSGFGGAAWATCAGHALSLYDLLAEGKDIKPIISKAHTLLNCAHNNGWMFNKLISSDVFDELAALDVSRTLGAAAVAMTMLSKGLSLPEERFNPESKLFCDIKHRTIDQRLSKYLNTRYPVQPVAVGTNPLELITPYFTEGNPLRAQARATTTESADGSVFVARIHVQLGSNAAGYATLDFNYYMTDDSTPAREAMLKQMFTDDSLHTSRHYESKSYSGSSTDYLRLTNEVLEVPELVTKFAAAINSYMKKPNSIRDKYATILGDIFNVNS